MTEYGSHELISCMQAPIHGGMDGGGSLSLLFKYAMTYRSPMHEPGSKRYLATISFAAAFAAAIPTSWKIGGADCTCADKMWVKSPNQYRLPTVQVMKIWHPLCSTRSSEMNGGMSPTFMHSTIFSVAHMQPANDGMDTGTPPHVTHMHGYRYINPKGARGVT